MPLKDTNPFMDPTPEEYESMKADFLDCNLGDEVDFEEWLARASDTYESIQEYRATRTPEQEAADKAATRRILKEVFPEDYI